MKRFTASLSVAVLMGALAGSALAAEGVRDEGSQTECHLKFPAIRPRTLATDNPQVKSATSGDVIDYYGACDESPTGRDQVLQQRHDEEFRFGRDYEDGD